MKLKIIALGILFFFSLSVIAQEKKSDRVTIIDVNQMILPGTSDYIKSGIALAEDNNSSLLVVKLNTPGGMLTSTQEIIQSLFKAKIPIAVYVSPSGGMAASAGVFITMAGHIAAMSPGTSMGAAHPVNSDGGDIKGDLRQKAENITIAMVKSIAEQRGRNVKWAEKAVKESSSLTEREAVKEGVIDFVADDLTALLKLVKGKEVKLEGGRAVILPDLTGSEQITLAMNFREKATNLISNPQVVALLWLGATTGIGAEIYHPGLIFPGVLGVICLILALLASQVIPINTGGILLLVLGVLLLGMELYVPSGILAIGGIIAMLFGLVYLFDLSKAPDIHLALTSFLPFFIILVSGFLFLIYSLIKTKKAPLLSGYSQLINLEGTVVEEIGENGGRVSVNGERWKAVSGEGLIKKGDKIKVVEANGDLLELKVKKI